jgi:hypothetical protein
MKIIYSNTRILANDNYSWAMRLIANHLDTLIKN